MIPDATARGSSAGRAAEVIDFVLLSSANGIEALKVGVAMPSAQPDVAVLV